MQMKQTNHCVEFLILIFLASAVEQCIESVEFDSTLSIAKYETLLIKICTPIIGYNNCNQNKVKI